MPLFTDDIGLARVAYSALEARATAAESRAAALEVANRAIAIHEPLTIEDSRKLGNSVLLTLAANTQLQARQEQVVASKADITLGNVIAAYGLAAAIAESTMPDRAIPTISASLRSYMILENGDVGLRFWQPEIGGGAFATSTFDLVKTPPASGAITPLRLFRVLQAKLAAYASPFWQTRGPSVSILVSCATTLAETAAWNFRFLLGQATQLAALESQLAGATFASSDATLVTAYKTATAALATLTTALAAKTTPVAGDFFALEAALDVTTRAATLLG